MSQPFAMVLQVTAGARSPSFLRVCGSTVVARLAILAKRCGAASIAITGEPADVERARTILANDPRVEGVALSFGEPGTASDLPRIEGHADVVVSSEVMKRLVVAAEPSFVPGAETLRRPGERPVALWQGEAPPGAYVLPVRDANDVAHARHVVIAYARSAGSSPVARHLHERFSQPVSRWLAETPVTANQVTFVNTALGFLAAWYWAVGTIGAFAIGGLLMQVTSVLDCVDGELARGKMLESKWGAWFDTVGDHVVNLAWVIALAVGYGRLGADRDVAWAAHVGPLSTAMVVLSFTLVGGLFLFLLVKRAGTKLKDVAATFRENERKPSPLFRLLDKFYVLGRRASIAILFTAFSVLPAVTGIVAFLDALFFATIVFLFFANLYFLVGAVGMRLARRTA